MEPAVRHPSPSDVDAFRAWVEVQPERYELVRGRLIMMAGGSATQNDIQVNLLAALRQRRSLSSGFDRGAAGPAARTVRISWCGSTIARADFPTPA
jgi:hypothetical protein